jgi:hypothetical protein
VTASAYVPEQHGTGGLAQEEWEIVRLPAIAEEDETLVVDTPLGPRCFERWRGEA